MNTTDPFAPPSAELGPSSRRVDHYGDASHGQRFLNLLIDSFALQVWQLVLLMPVIVLAGDQAEAFTWPVVFAAYFTYYAGLEGLFGRTVGKLVTGTRVVRIVDACPPTWTQILGRTASRWVPFEPFSFLGSERGWHDVWTKTHVVRVRT